MLAPVRVAWDELFRAARSYARRHPESIRRSLRSVLGLRISVPLAALRWGLQQVLGRGQVQDLELQARPPGLRVGAAFELMKTPLRGAAVLYVERIQASGEALQVTLRLEDVQLRVDGEADTPVAMLVRSGALDLSRPGDVVAHLPKRPPIVAEASGNRIVLDLMRLPALRDGSLPRALLALGTAVATVQAIETDADHLELQLRPLPQGLAGPVQALRTRVMPLLRGRLLPS